MLGFSCAQGRVLYVNLEIDPASCIDRFITIYAKLGFSPPHTDNIVIWNLRGHALPLDRLVPILVRRMKDEQFAAVIIDPIYKVITGDENNASDMALSVTSLIRSAPKWARRRFTASSLQGRAGGKKAMDRASGSRCVRPRSGRAAEYHRAEKGRCSRKWKPRPRRRGGRDRAVRHNPDGMAAGSVAA